ncbi:hypothetical protein AtubIFM57258_002926 [Aspergillus tubingensis]|nr:hypothetical protein AtubIFM57258_002926 [Aspergillus tubingensis]
MNSRASKIRCDGQNPCANIAGINPVGEGVLDGALLLPRSGHLEEAAQVYRADLGLDNTLVRQCRHPNNVWSLQGYHECLVRLGKLDEAAMIEQSVKLALAVADVPIKASCFCRLDTSQAPQVLEGCCSKE